MCTKYSEVVLAVRFRERNSHGDYVGGPMYYIKNGLGKNWKWLGALFCIFGALAAFGIGNAVQIGNITDSINTAIQAFYPADVSEKGTINLILGIVLAVLVAVVSIGGIKRIGAVTEKMIPFMSLVYIVGSLAVIFINYERIIPVFGDIFRGAFDPSAVVGGALGVSIKECISSRYK